jgi:hypothetical protein
MGASPLRGRTFPDHFIRSGVNAQDKRPRETKFSQW